MMVGGVLLFLCALVLVAVLPFVRINSRPVALASPTPVSSPSTPAPVCVAGGVPHFYADNPVNPSLAGPGSVYKTFANDFGPSAVPVKLSVLSASSVLEAVREEYLHRLCADKKLFQVGYMGLDVRHLARSPYHPDLNPNTPLSDVRWQQELVTYAGAIRWDLSRIETETIPAGSWTLMMVPRPGSEPIVKAVARLQASASHVLILAVTQPDGSVAYEQRRLECGFQPVYGNNGEVPVALSR